MIEEGAIQTNEANNKQENENIIIASIDEPVITEEPIEVNINRQPFLIINTPVNKKIYNKNNLIKSIFNQKKKKEREEAILEFNKGMSKWGALQHFKAIEHFDKGIKADPTYFENYMRKAYVLNCIKKYADVVECYDKAIKYLPNELEAYYGKAEALVNLKKYNDAIKEYGKIIKIDPEQTDAKIERENCLRELENK